MAAQRTIACPHCGTERVTKATGRQRLACPSSSCGRSFLVRDAGHVETVPAAAPPPTAAAAGTPPPEPAEVPVSEPASSPASGIAGVEVLPPAALRLTAPAFEGNPPEDGGPPSEPPAGDRPGVATDPAQPEPVLTGGSPVSAGPGRRLGYYGRVTGRG